jgi:hypothetical protein
LDQVFARDAAVVVVVAVFSGDVVEVFFCK